MRRSSPGRGVYATFVVHLAVVAVAVGHAETIGHRLGEPFGTLVLALAVTVIEVALIVALMASEGAAAAFRAGARGDTQTGVNLALGSALASIGLTIPAVAVASIWLDGPVELGLPPKDLVLLALTTVVSTLTFGAGRATLLHAAHHLTVFAAFVFLAAVP